MQFCIRGKASTLAETRLSHVFSIEMQAIRTKELVSESSCQVFDDTVDFVTDLWRSAGTGRLWFQVRVNSRVAELEPDLSTAERSIERWFGAAI